MLEFMEFMEGVLKYTYYVLEWSQMKDFKKEKKLGKNPNNFPIHFFTFHNILHLFLPEEKNTYLVADRGLTPPLRLLTYPQL